LLDLECLAHELEHDCNYPFAGLRDARGELYSTKLARLREQLANIDAMLNESDGLVRQLRDVRRKWDADRALLAGALMLLSEYGHSIGSSELIAAADRANLETCQCCGDMVGMSKVTVQTGGVYCPRCKSTNAQPSGGGTDQ
jgi:hypothetical protein